MNFVHLIQRVAHTVNNDVVRPLDRLVNPKQQPPSVPPNFDPQNQHLYPGSFYGAMPLHPANSNPKLANPREIANRPLAKAVFAPADKNTQDKVDQASQIFGFMPKFKEIINAAQPQVPPNSENGLDSGGGLKNVPAAGLYYPGRATNYTNNQAIKLASPAANDPSVVTHEALHAAWQQEPDTRTQFAKAFNTSVSPKIKEYLDLRLRNYTDYKGKKSLDNFNKLSPSIQTEVHSYLSEFPFFHSGSPSFHGPSASSKREPLPSALQKYYNQYINTSDAPKKLQERNRVGLSVRQLIGQLPYGELDE
jgi:hypothetical protein